MIGAMEDFMNQGLTEDQATEQYFRSVYGQPVYTVPAAPAAPVAPSAARRPVSPVGVPYGTMFDPFGRVAGQTYLNGRYSVSPVINGYSPYATAVVLPYLADNVTAFSELMRMYPMYDYRGFYADMMKKALSAPSRRRSGARTTQPAQPLSPPIVDKNGYPIIPTEGLSQAQIGPGGIPSSMDKTLVPMSTYTDEIARGPEDDGRSKQFSKQGNNATVERFLKRSNLFGL